MTTIIDFLCDIKHYLNDSHIKQYYKICNINLKNLALNSESTKFKSEIDSLVKICLNHYPIIKEICTYIDTRKSKIKFLKKFSAEQISYITNLDLTDTKLLACAGSGKTRSIIGRIKFLTEHLAVPKSNIFMITFSKIAANDFHNKIQNLFPNFESWAQLKNFSTIDSLAKSILCRIKSHKSNNVEILSIAFRNYLQNICPEEIHLIKKIKNIQHLFVDEAQDLNQVQFEAICLIKKYFGTSIHLVGDPNQNIFQFRRSSSLYLMNFSAKIYHLSLNFRSTQAIINFSENLKPIQTIPTKSATNKIGPKVVVVSKSIKDTHQMILDFIATYPKDLSNIAIVCPTKGTGKYNTVGLSVFFNLFKINKIPFNQLYDEAGSNDERKKDTAKISGHVNLLTWHGTKGLEFDTVFVMDMYHNIFNIKPSESEHQNNLYLLYVATTRASEQMFCCTYTDTHFGYLNSWLTQVNPDYYTSPDKLKIAQMSFRPETEKVHINGITDIIAELSDIDLDKIDSMIEIVDNFEKRIYLDFTHIDRNKDETLFGIFVEELFYLQYRLSRRTKPRKLSLIELIIESKFIIVENDSECSLLKNFITKNQMTWTLYDTIAHTIRSDIKSLVEKYFHRDTEMTSFVVCTNEFIQIVSANLVYIKQANKKYLNPELYQYKYQSIIVDFFYLIVVQYAYNNNHYYYINYFDQSKQILLENGKELFRTINLYVRDNYLGVRIQEKKLVSYPKLGLIGEIDFEEVHQSGSEVIVDIKCVKEISIKFYIQLLMYNFCKYWNKSSADLYCNYFKILNLLTGIEHTVLFKISRSNMFDLLNIFAGTGNLKFSDMTLVYDLETTNKIIFHGPFNIKPNVIRGRIWIKNRAFYAETYPDITEIAITDYDTGMIIINQLVKPNTPVHPEVERLTGIWNSMLVNKPDINQIRSFLDTKFAHFISGSKLLAHNGTCFDNKIMICDNLVDLVKFTFLDTMSVIPIHMPVGTQLKKKSVGEIYKQLFRKTFKAHRAMADVNALIEIMKELNICF